MADIIKHSANHFSENFETLVSQIKSIGDALQQDARVVINRNITTKAWLTGYYIVEYEQHGKDRAKYGEGLLQKLSKRLGGKSYSATNLRSYRLFLHTLSRITLRYSQLPFRTLWWGNGGVLPNNISSSTDSAVTDC